MPINRRVALATCEALPTGDEDAAALLSALDRIGIAARWVVWTAESAADVDEPVVLRSTWDYSPRRAEFLAWVGELARVANPVELVGWSSDKRYLADLASAGVPVVPTRWLAPGEVLDHDFGSELVIKPSVGAGSRGAGRFTPDRASAAAGHVAMLHAEGRTAMVQPYLDSVDTAGETALVFIAGRFSHAIRKGAMLPAGVAHPVHSWQLYVEEQIEPRVPSAAELSVGDQVLALIDKRFGANPLYARIDLLDGPDGPVVVEAELVEPSLFLSHATGAVDRFAAAIGELT